MRESKIANGIRQIILFKAVRVGRITLFAQQADSPDTTNNPGQRSDIRRQGIRMG